MCIPVTLSVLHRDVYKRQTLDGLQGQYLVKISINPANEADMAALVSFLDNQKLNQKKLINAVTGSHRCV